MRIFQTQDCSGREIYLTQERFKHITEDHSEVFGYLSYFESILKHPEKTSIKENNKTIHYFYKHFKEKAFPRYLLLVVKYLNGEGFIITAYFVKETT